MKDKKKRIVVRIEIATISDSNEKLDRKKNGSAGNGVI